MPNGVALVLQQGLAQDPEERISRAGKLMAALTALSDSSQHVPEEKDDHSAPVTDLTDSRPQEKLLPSRSTRHRSGPRWSWVQVGLIGAVLLLLCIVAGFGCFILSNIGGIDVTGNGATSTRIPLPPESAATPIPTPIPKQFQPNSLVTGLVASYIDGPLEGVSVWLGKGDWGCGRRDYMTKTDATGRYTFGNIPPSQYCVSVNYDQSGPGFYNASWAGEQSKSSSQDLKVRTLYLLRWDLNIIFPTTGQTLDNTTHVFQWETYPLASQYSVLITKSPDSDAETEVYDETTTDTFLEITLDKGTYELFVHALSGDTIIAFYNVSFSIEP